MKYIYNMVVPSKNGAIVFREEEFEPRFYQKFGEIPNILRNLVAIVRAVDFQDRLLTAIGVSGVNLDDPSIAETIERFRRDLDKNMRLLSRLNSGH